MQPDIAARTALALETNNLRGGAGAAASLQRVIALQAAGVALIAAFSAVDMLGALFRGIGLRSSGGPDADAQALSYHRR